MIRSPLSGFVVINTVLSASRVVGFEAFFVRKHYSRLFHLYHSKMTDESKNNNLVNAVHHVSDDMTPSFMRKERTKILTKDTKAINNKGTAVYYWMQRDMRSIDNWALLFAEFLAKEKDLPLKVLYVLPPVVPKSKDESPSKVCEMNMVSEIDLRLYSSSRIFLKK